MVTKGHGDAFSRQHMRLWQWTPDYCQDAFEFVNREQSMLLLA